MFTILVMTYILVLGAEVVGDKTFYTLGTLAARYRLLPIFCGSLLAFMLKMLAAVLLGSAIAQLPQMLVASLSAATFFIMAFVIWFKNPEERTPVATDSRSWFKIALASFASIFFTEWGDVGQIATATLAARYGTPYLVWAGAVLAMTTKGVFAMTLGSGLRKHVPQSVLRYSTFGLCILMGILALFRVEV
jgi:putative Ca2+/H+ antiporter (TMEM165/GDT1 family)